MKLILSAYSHFRDLKFRTKLLLSYIVLITIPMFILSYKYYGTSMDMISQLASRNVYEIVKQNNQIIDSELSRVEDKSMDMVTDEKLFNDIRNVRPEDKYELVKADKDITSLISKYLSEGRDVYSAQIITDSYVFGSSTTYLTSESFNNSDLHKKAVEANGSLIWIPTYDYLKKFDMGDLSGASLDYKYLFSAVRLLNISYIENGIVVRLDSNIKRPILLVNFKEDLYRDLFDRTIPIKGAYYFVVDKWGNTISHSDTSKIASVKNDEWLKEIVKKGSGSDIVKIDGKKMIVCYDTSNVTDWLSAVVISPGELMSSFLPTIRTYTFYLALMLLCISLIFAFIISGSITKPLKRLLAAIKKTGEGDFDTKVQVDDKSEVGYLLKKFNNMNEKIKLLIEENYKTRIREKETEIMALNVQLNPHFLYNTLNIINWMAIENGQNDISKMLVSLSTMLQYTSQNHNEITSFKDDFEWLQNYIFVMSMRYEGKFTVNYDIDPELFKYKVPKLFLQPFVENSIIHGFENMESGGVIKISGWMDNEKRYFEVEDNGTGIIRKVSFDEASSGKKSTGIKNVDRRIKLIYGDAYGVNVQSGTHVDAAGAGASACPGYAYSNTQMDTAGADPNARPDYGQPKYQAGTKVTVILPKDEPKGEESS